METTPGQAIQLLRPKESTSYVIEARAPLTIGLSGTQRDLDLTF